jgi:hypothetical protein
MKSYLKIFTIFILISIPLSGFTRFEIQSDTAKNRQNITSQGRDNTKDKTLKENSGKSAGVKQVKGARPDMSRARGARPPYIERQSGTGIPRGIGKPGGAVKPGKR